MEALVTELRLVCNFPCHGLLLGTALRIISHPISHSIIP